ncbi:MAG: penicillin-binding transpeptidase domain-containing protein [Balneolaceae bacterium]
MNERSAIMGRMFILMGFIFLLPFAIFVQMFRVNVMEGDGLRELWNSQAIDFIAIPAERGKIYDVNGSVLATNSVVYKVAIDPHYPGVTADKLQQVYQAVASHTGRSASTYQSRVRSAPANSRYVVLERSVPVQAYDDLRALGIRAVILEQEFRRLYNFDALAAHVLGYVNHNMDGMNGLEAYYDDVLRGVDGRQQVRRDRANRIFAYVGAPRQQPQQGHSLHSTIDSFIQAIAEEELERGVRHHRAKSGTAIVMNPKTGAIKAMANFPTFNPNHPGADESENRRNFAVADMMEPGSTFKLVTAVAAVQQNQVSFDEVFETPESGQIQIHGQWMRDHDPLGSLSFTQAIAKSSNIATSEIAMRIEPETFFQYARNFGFGTQTQIDLPNESRGRLQRPYEWSMVTQPWLSIGYEMQATPLQILQAYGAFANQGKMMKPYVVESITNEFNSVVRRTRPEMIRKVADHETINKLLPVFETVVSDSGTAGWAAVDGLKIAGKTGTAQKFIDGRYTTAYRASFAGFFPADDPEYVMLVILDEPRTSFYGGFTAGSIFKEIATRIAGLDSRLHRNKWPVVADAAPPETPSVTGLSLAQASAILDVFGARVKTTGNGSFVIAQQPEAGTPLAGNRTVQLEFGTIQPDDAREGMVQIPDLRSMSMRQAATIVRSLGLEFERVGSGTIYNQFPLAGEWMRTGRTVTVRGRARAIEQAITIAENE